MTCSAAGSDDEQAKGCFDVAARRRAIPRYSGTRNAMVRISMLSRGGAHAGRGVVSVAAPCPDQRARPSVLESKHFSSTASFVCMREK